MAFQESCNKLAGSYDLAYKGAGESTYRSIGRTDEEGIKIIISDAYETITGDQFGSHGDVDGYYIGRRVTLEFVLQELSTLFINEFLYPWTTYTSNLPFRGQAAKVPPTGMLVSDAAGDLRATPRTGTPAATDESDPYYFKGISSGPYEINWNTKLRVVPVIFKVIPRFDSISAGYDAIYHWTTTEPTT